MTDLINRADAIAEISKGVWYVHELIGRIKELPSAEVVHIEAYRELYEKYVELKHASADAEQGFRGGKIPPKEVLDGTVLIPKHQWLEMERELAELKQEFESAEAVQGEWIEKGGELVCSICGNSVSFSRTPTGWVLGKFCQSCGARMKGGAE